ncbi:MAG: dihydroorotate dehydrogenase-like protein [Lentisphaeria bacterium]
MSITTQYLGLKLKNPLIVGSSPLTHSIKGIKHCAEAGAGALVLKSLFEEQIREQTSALSESLAQQAGLHDEVYQYIEAGLDMRYGTREYLQMLADAKNETDIPIIASLNCISDKWWLDFARELEASGADALELNIAVLPKSLKDTAPEIERRYLDISRQAIEAVDIPVSVKLGPYFTSLPEMLDKLQSQGVRGFVLFNRFYRPTIDIGKQEVVPGDRFSANRELSITLRNLALFSGALPGDFAAASGIHTGADLIRTILAGAAASQVVTTLLKHNVDYISTMLDELKVWMEKNGYDELADFRGNLSQAKTPEAELFSRTQYIEAIGGRL